MDTLVICVCTCQRPQMLFRCLSSLIEQEVSGEWNIVYVVVDNEPEANNEHIVASFQERTSFRISYVHQPKRGIAVARNAALNEAVKYQPQWICFFDDDQYADRFAIKKALLAAKKYQADVVSMRLQMVAQKVCSYQEQKKTADGKKLKKCGAGGVLFSSHLVTDNGLKLRFNEGFGLAPGEDSEFFFAAFCKGANIVSSQEALIYEVLLAERMTFSYSCVQKYSATVAKMNLYVQNRQTKVLLRFILLACIKLVTALLELPFLPFYLLGGVSFFKYKLIKISRRLLLFCGVLTAFFKINLNPYKKIIGN